MRRFFLTGCLKWQEMYPAALLKSHVHNVLKGEAESMVLSFRK